MIKCNIVYTVLIGGICVNSRKIVQFFFKTLIYGGLAGLITSFIVEWNEYAVYLQPFDAIELLGVFLFFLGYALVFTVVSQTGFFAYLFVHRFGQGFFKSIWPMVQLLIVFFAIFDLIYLTSKNIPMLFKVIMTIVVVIVGIIVARMKVKETNPTAFIPTLFVMIVMTALELTLVLRPADTSFIILMLVPVLVANAYQILQLHKTTEVTEEHRQRIAARRKARLEKQKQKLKEQGKEEQLQKLEELERSQEEAEKAAKLAAQRAKRQQKQQGPRHKKRKKRPKKRK